MSSVLTLPAQLEKPEAGTPSQRALRRFFSFPVAIAGLLSALAVLTARGRFNDPDMWWHLKTGQLIWTTRTIPSVDLFSSTANYHRLVPHEWLAQAAIYDAYRWGGFSGMMLAFCCLAVTVMVTGYALCALYARNAKVAFIGALALFFFATTGFSLRPQLLGYLFLIIEMLIIHLGRIRSARWFFVLPPLFVLWINCHGSFFMGLIVAGILLFTSYFHFEIGSLIAEPWTAHRRRIFAVSLALSTVATLLNPGGIRQILYPLDTMLRQPLNLASIEEWHPLDMSSLRGICFFAVLGAIFLLVLMRKTELYLDELLLLALGAWLGASHVRLLFVFGILAAPILARMLANVWENYHPHADRIMPNAVLLVLALGTAIIAFPSAQNIAGQIEEQNPVKAVSFIHAHHLVGPMLNEYRYGGYLIWAAPEYPVFIDGRADLYEWSGVLGQFGAWATLQSDPSALLDKYGIQFCLLSAQSPMARVLLLLPGWKSIYADSNAVIFARVPAQN